MYHLLIYSYNIPLEYLLMSKILYYLSLFIIQTNIFKSFYMNPLQNCFPIFENLTFINIFLLGLFAIITAIVPCSLYIDCLIHFFTNFFLGILTELFYFVHVLLFFLFIPFFFFFERTFRKIYQSINIISLRMHAYRIVLFYCCVHVLLFLFIYRILFLH